jgi:hypothetical protein
LQPPRDGLLEFPIEIDRITVRMTIPRRSDGFVSRVFGDETIVVPVRAGVANLEAIFTFNAVAATIWGRIDGAASVDDLAKAVAGEYAVTLAEAGTDVAAFVETLASKGLVEMRAPKGPAVAAEASP